jgi:hypothetical protein
MENGTVIDPMSVSLKGGRRRNERPGRHDVLRTMPSAGLAGLRIKAYHFLEQ